MVIQEIKKIESSTKKLREFGFVVGGVFAALGIIFLWRGKAHYPYFLAPGVFLGLLGAVAPGVLKPLQKGWMTLAILMGWVMTRVLLSALFYLVLTPIGLILRLTGKDLLDLRFPAQDPSFWKLSPKDTRAPSDYEKQF
ncbi:MAG: hypothetical protein KTQ49_08470 [Candidatus Omnitrophica bacterium]|nr:hypothetical protein [Candidatus Omnitrophota bacterium]